MKKHKKTILIISLILISTIFIKYGITYAKYVYNSIWNYYLESKGFYFSSDYLDSTTIKNVNNQWSGENISFNIKNNLNKSVISQYDINYQVTCNINGESSEYAECHLNGTESNQYSGTLSKVELCQNNTNDGVDVRTYNQTNCEISGYKWITEVAEQEIFFNIVNNDNTYHLNDVSVTITVTSTSPYRKTITGQFILHRSNTPEEQILISYQNYSNYNKLIITNTYLNNKCTKISWNSAKVKIDIDQEPLQSTVDENGYINSITLNLNPKTNIDYIFYDTDEITTLNDFTQEEVICPTE